LLYPETGSILEIFYESVLDGLKMCFHQTSQNSQKNCQNSQKNCQNSQKSQIYTIYYIVIVIMFKMMMIKMNDMFC